LGADAETGFYIRHGYQTTLLLQWAYDPSRFDAEVAALIAGPVKEMTWHRDSFGGVPQLFVDLDEPSPLVRDQVQDLVRGAHVGYCMTKAISAPARADNALGVLFRGHIPRNNTPRREGWVGGRRRGLRLRDAVAADGGGARGRFVRGRRCGFLGLGRGDV